MPHRVDFFTSYTILLYSFKNANVTMKFGINAAGEKLII